MTHSDILTKFLIEYDKANITSSYPSLTNYEIATILDKAYFAIVGEKVIGNNPRRAPFEIDVKAIEDLRPLIITTDSSLVKDSPIEGVDNGIVFKLPEDLLYYVQGKASLRSYKSVDGTLHSKQNVKLLSHEDASKFMSTTINTPWVKEPVAYVEGDKIVLLVDLYENKNAGRDWKFYLTYIKQFAKFTDTLFDNTKFELTDTMAEELINLAIIFATEIVESPRMTAKTNIRPLES